MTAPDYRPVTGHDFALAPVSAVSQGWRRSEVMEVLVGMSTFLYLNMNSLDVSFSDHM